MKYTVTGTNERGEAISEVIEVPRRTRRQRVQMLLVRVLGMRLASWLGLTGFKYITAISVNKYATASVRPWTVDRDGRVNINSRKIEMRAK